MRWITAALSSARCAVSAGAKKAKTAQIAKALFIAEGLGEIILGSPSAAAHAAGSSQVCLRGSLRCRPLRSLRRLRPLLTCRDHPWGFHDEVRRAGVRCGGRAGSVAGRGAAAGAAV